MPYRIVLQNCDLRALDKLEQRLYRAKNLESLGYRIEKTKRKYT
jgi:hypothetical protein